MSGKRPPRLKSFDYRGRYRYFLTICAAERRAAFADPARAAPVVRHFLRFATLHGFAVPAYCVMPDHLHALAVGLTDDADLRRFVCRFKQRTGFEWKQRTGQTLWQEGYYDRVLREEETSLDVIGYIANNAVEAGLARSVAEYPLFGSTEYSIEEVVAILEEWTRERATDRGLARESF